jgi:hypothetical protein
MVLHFEFDTAVCSTDTSSGNVLHDWNHERKDQDSVPILCKADMASEATKTNTTFYELHEHDSILYQGQSRD